MKSIITIFALIFLCTQLSGATYTHNDLHKEIDVVQEDINKFDNRLVVVETKVNEYDSFANNFKNKDYTLTTIIQNISYGAYALIVIIIGFFWWLCTFIGRSITRLEENYAQQYNDIVQRHNNKLIAIEENADRVMSKILSISGTPVQDESLQTNSTDPF